MLKWVKYVFATNLQTHLVPYSIIPNKEVFYGHIKSKKRART